MLVIAGKLNSGIVARQALVGATTMRKTVMAATRPLSVPARAPSFHDVACVRMAGRMPTPNSANRASAPDKSSRGAVCFGRQIRIKPQIIQWIDVEDKGGIQHADAKEQPGD